MGGSSGTRMPMNRQRSIDVRHHWFRRCRARPAERQRLIDDQAEATPIRSDVMKRDRHFADRPRARNGSTDVRGQVRVLLALAVLLIGSATVAFAQSSPSIAGGIRDSSGAVLPGVTVEAA